jgi:hypothetical protein
VITFGAITSLLYHFFENVVKRYGLSPVVVLQNHGYGLLTGSRCFHDVPRLGLTVCHGYPFAVDARSFC